MEVSTEIYCAFTDVIYSERSIKRLNLSCGQVDQTEVWRQLKACELVYREEVERLFSSSEATALTAQLSKLHI